MPYIAQMPSSLRRIILLLPALLAIAACSPAQQGDGPPTVLAASSLQDAMEDAADAWEALGHARPRLSFAASSALARQIQFGAPADIFVSADMDWMDYLADKGLIRPGSRTIIASNSLVLVAPAAGGGKDIGGGPHAVSAVLAELGNGRIAMGEPEVVPAGRYGRAALETLGLWQEVERHVVPAENVRAALALVENGEAPLGIVYATDALASDRVRVRAVFPPSSHDPILYPGALLDTAGAEGADAFLAFLTSADGRAIFAGNGFGPPGR